VPDAASGAKRRTRAETSRTRKAQTPAASAAQYDHARPDIILFNGVNRREIVAIFSGVFSGKHLAHPKVETLQAASISVVADPPLRLMADGELLGHTPLRVRVLPAELVILA